MDRYSEMLKAAMDRGEPLDASLAALRQQGASIIESIKAVRETNPVSLSEAKRLVEASSTWEGDREARRQFVNEATAPHSAFPQSAGIGRFTIRDLLWLTVVVALLVALFVLPPRQVRWEYKAMSNLEQNDLNSLGIERWELVSLKPDNGGGATFYFKRPKSN